MTEESSPSTVPDQEPEATSDETRVQEPSTAPADNSADSTAASTDTNKRPVSRRTVARLIGAVIAVLGVLALVTFVTLPLWKDVPTLHGGAKPLAVVPSNVVEQRICPGPLRQQTNATAEDAGTALGSSTTQAVINAQSGTSVIGLASQQPLSGLEGGAAAPLGSWYRGTNLGAANVLQGTRADAIGALAATQSLGVNAGTTKGFALTSCDVSSFSGWLVAGSTAVGRTTAIRFVNTSAAVANVSLAMHTARGLSGETLEPLKVTPHSERTVSLAAYAPSSAAVAVSYTATGAPVAAFVQQTTVRGLNAGGFSLSNASANPTRHQVVPGIQIRDAGQQRAAADSGDFSDATNVLRVVAANLGGNVKVSLVRQDGHAVKLSTQLDTNEVTDIDLSNLADGTYTAYIDAPHSVTAAARTTTGGTTNPQFSWIASVEPQQSTRSVAVPDTLGNGSLVVANTSNSSATVTVTPVGGKSTTVQIAPKRNASIGIGAWAVASVKTNRPVAMALVATGSAGTSATVLPANPALSGSITVLP